MYKRDDIEELLRTYNVNKARLKLINDVLNSDQHGHELLSLQRNIDIVDSMLMMLSKEEQFIIQTHVIDGLDWPRTLVEHDNLWGSELGRSERTLKRKQQKAIDKMLNLINDLGI